MVNWCILIIVIGFVSQYIIHILDYPRRRHNIKITVQNLFCEDDEEQFLKPEPFWFEIITNTNQILVCGGLFILFIIGLLKLI